MKQREQELLQNLKQKLQQSDVADDLFEYLAIRFENEQTKLCKELKAETQGGVKELSKLLDIFAPVKVETS